MNDKVKRSSSLPEDNLLDILHLLPTKSLFQLMSVSKRWRDLISLPSSSFNCRSQRWGHSRMMGFFVQNREPDSAKIDFFATANEMMEYGKLDKFLNCLSELGYIVASSKGFLLCSRSKSNPMDYYVCNPITMQRVALPEPHNHFESVVIGFLCNVDDPSKDFISYKVVRFESKKLDEGLHHVTSLPIEIFSSETGKWVTINLVPVVPFKMGAINDPAIIVDGIFCWFDGISIVACDLVKQQCWLMKFPRISMGRAYSRCLGFSRGRLHFGLADELNLEIWIISGQFDPLNKNVPWVLKYRENLLNKAYQYPEIFGPSFLNLHIEFMGFDSTDLYIIFLGIRRHLVSYHLVTKKLEVIHIFDDPIYSFHENRGQLIFPYEGFEWPRRL